MAGAVALSVDSFKIASREQVNLSAIANKKIIVSGAGIAGLAFVVSLKAIWKEEYGTFPEIVQYERGHERPDLSREGYSLSIRSGGNSLGLQALKRMGLMDKVVDSAIVRETDDVAYHGLWSLDWTKMVNVHHPARLGFPRYPIRVTRTTLRNLLLDAAGVREKIIWGTGCRTIIPTIDNSIHVKLSNGKEDSCDLLVVADGANSHLRAACRPDDSLSFAGPVSISAIARFNGPPPFPFDKEWALIPSGTGVSLFVSPMDKTSVNWCISYLQTSPRLECRQPMTTEMCASLLAEAKARGSMFPEPFATLVDHSNLDTLMVFNAIDKKPFAHDVANGVPAGVVFIGDSNHAVSAFAANGANMALIDALDLAECLCTSASMEQAVRDYDARSLPRASASWFRGRLRIAVVHSSGVMWFCFRSVLWLYAVSYEVFSISMRLVDRMRTWLARR